jgi:hypothetical protein
MLIQNTFITEIHTADGLFAGPNIEAKTFHEAEQKCPGYAKVIGKLIFTFSHLNLINHTMSENKKENLEELTTEEFKAICKLFFDAGYIRAREQFYQTAKKNVPSFEKFYNKIFK